MSRSKPAVMTSAYTLATDEWKACLASRRPRVKFILRNMEGVKARDSRLPLDKLLHIYYKEDYLGSVVVRDEEVVLRVWKETRVEREVDE